MATTFRLERARHIFTEKRLIRELSAVLIRLARDLLDAWVHQHFGHGNRDLLPDIFTQPLRLDDARGSKPRSFFQPPILSFDVHGRPLIKT